MAQLVRVLLVPLEPALAAEDAEGEPVLGTGRGLGDPERADRTARPSASEAASGLSQSTPSPASRAAVACGRWSALGVMTATTSMPSGHARSPAGIAAKSG